MPEIFLSVACSSFMRPHNERIVEDLLTQVHSGKITPLQIDDDLATPSSDENPLLISNIMASTPARCLDGPVRSMERLDATAVNHLIRDSLLLGKLGEYYMLTAARVEHKDNERGCS